LFNFFFASTRLKRLALHLGFIFLPEKGLTCQKGSNFPTFRKEKEKKPTHKPKRQDDDHTRHNRGTQIMLEGFVSTFSVACQSILIRHSQLETKPPLKKFRRHIINIEEKWKLSGRFSLKIYCRVATTFAIA
jgi:hypothetical protein